MGHAEAKLDQIARRLPCAARAGHSAVGGGLPEQTHPHSGRRRARWPDRSFCTDLRSAIAGAQRPAGGSGEQLGRDRHDRRRSGGEVAARWIHAVAGPSRQRNDLAADQSQIAIQSRKRFRAGGAGGPGRQPAAGVEKLAHTFGAGVDCDGEGAAGNADICFARGGEFGSHGDRTVQARRRNRPDPRPLSRLNAGDDRSDRRSGVAHHRHRAVQPRPGPRGCIARIGRRRRHPRPGAAGRSDHGRGGRARRAGRIVAGAVCSRKYPARGYCLSEQRGPRDLRPSRMFASAWSRRAWCYRKDRRKTSPRSSPSRIAAGEKSSSAPRSNSPH